MTQEAGSRALPGPDDVGLRKDPSSSASLSSAVPLGRHLGPRGAAEAAAHDPLPTLCGLWSQRREEGVLARTHLHCSLGIHDPYGPHQ